MPCRLRMMTQTKHLRRETQYGDVLMCCVVLCYENRRRRWVFFRPPEKWSRSRERRRRKGRFKQEPSAQKEEGEEARFGIELVGCSQMMMFALWQEDNRTSSFVLSAIILWKPIPTPSMTARKTAHMMAELRAALTPPRTAREPPVKKPAIMAFQGSSFLRIPLIAQS